jgi:glycerol-3-phosphate acyltransferase PlsY
VFDEYLIIPKLFGAILAGYVLGSIPFALVAARLRGVDIFNTGSKTAGTANVFWNIGRGTGIGVLVGDVAKGAAAVLIAESLGLQWQVALLAGGAAVLGHWKSVFSGFRGGDGMASLMGVCVVMEPLLTTLGLLIGMGALLLSWRSPLRSAWALSSCFIVMLGVSQYYQIDRELVMGLVALAMLVLFHSVVSRRHRGSASDEEDPIGLGLGPDEEPDLAPAAPENR